MSEATMSICSGRQVRVEGQQGENSMHMCQGYHTSCRVRRRRAGGLTGRVKEAGSGVGGGGGGPPWLSVLGESAPRW